ncbi:dual specificity protein phosphatase family protein [Planctomycetota bacterium]
MTEEKEISPNNDSLPQDPPRAIIPEKRPNHILRAVIIVAIIGLGIWIWDATKYRMFPKRFGVVEQGMIYRSGQLHPALVERTLRKHNIKTVISLTGDVPDDPYIAAENAAVEKLDLEFYRFPLHGDGTGDVEQYIEAIAAMVAAKQNGRPVLVHCAAGAQRTGGTIAFYRLLVEKQDPETVYREMCHYDWKDKADAPLLPYVNKHIRTVAEGLLDRGIIGTIPDPLPQLTSKHQK